MAATDLCMPLAQGVPGQYWTQGPQWWTPGPAAQLTQLDDPRWRGAVNRSYDNGTGLEAAFRGIYHVDGGQTYLMMSFQVYTDPDATGQADLVWLGLQRGGHGSGAPAYIIKVECPAAVTAIDAGPTGGVQWATVPENGGTETAVVGATPQLEDAHWLTLPGGGNNVYSWALNLRIPVRNGGADIDANGLNLGNIGDTFAFWFTIIVDHGQKDPNDPNAYIAVPYTYPRTMAAGLTGLHADPTFPSTANWAKAKLGGVDCGSGISLAGSDITANNGTNNIHAVLGQTTTNTFTVKPFNNGITAGVDAGALEATFRIANWGSQTPIDKAPPNMTDWQEIPFAGTPPNAPVGTGGGHPTNQAAIPNGQYGDLHFDWLIDANTAQYWSAANPLFAPHQCVYAQLKEVGGSGFDFINDSAYNNMNVVPTASPAVTAAEFSVKGRPATVGPKGGSQKLYVFVERSSAPRPMNAAQYKQLLLKERQQPAPTPVEKPSVPVERTPVSPITQAPVSPIERAPVPLTLTPITGLVGHMEINQPAEPIIARIAGLDLPTIVKALPAFKYHAYYSTGVKIHTRPGRLVTLYDPQTSFGYVVAHQGPLYGWSHSITPPAAGRSPFVAKGVIGLKEQPVQIAADRFAIDIPHNEAVVARTVITPILQPPKLDPAWLAWFKRLVAPSKRTTS